jgi:hypothetical protein
MQVKLYMRFGTPRINVRALPSQKSLTPPALKSRKATSFAAAAKRASISPEASPRDAEDAGASNIKSSRSLSPLDTDRHQQQVSLIRSSTAHSLGFQKLQKLITVKDAGDGQHVVDALGLKDGHSLVAIAENNLQHMEGYLRSLHKRQVQVKDVYGVCCSPPLASPLQTLYPDTSKWCS